MALIRAAVQTNLLVDKDITKEYFSMAYYIIFILGLFVHVP